MLIFHKQKDLTNYLSSLKNEDIIGFVPTMGALHEGHLSLISECAKQCQKTVCSIYVNPTQFNNKEDLAKYPRTIATDIEMLAKSDCDILFLPNDNEMYPNGEQSDVVYDLGKLEHTIEGAFRPGHFQGVAQIVDKLLRIVKPHRLFLGQKDLQQIAIIKKMAKSLHPNTDIITVSTKRESDGLAMSSRNRRLNIVERSRATIIYQCLVSIKTKNGITPFSIVKKECEDILERKGLKVEYVSLIDLDTFEQLDDYQSDKEMAAVIAAFNGNIRLIDNILL